jgi:hypothetical protein
MKELSCTKTLEKYGIDMQLMGLQQSKQIKMQALSKPKRRLVITKSLPVFRPNNLDSEELRRK